MKPDHLLAETNTPDGGRLSLHLRDGVFTIRLNGQALMDSSRVASEQVLGELAFSASATSQAPHVLIGGLGLGFTLRRVLDHAPASAAIEVVELIPAVIAWNHTHLAGLNGRCLADPRVRVVSGDVARSIADAAAGSYDAILLDIDNGPVAMVRRENARLYTRDGIRQIIAALKAGGRLAVWSAGRDDKFADRLASRGLEVAIVPAKLHPNARNQAVTIYVADKFQQ